MALVKTVKDVWSRRQKPTPSHIDKLFTNCSKLCGWAVIAVTSAPSTVVGTTETTMLSWCFAVAGGFFMEVKRFFVVETKETEVPIEDVQVMDEPASKN